MNFFADVHCHLDICPDIPGIVTRARKANVNAIITQGTNPESNRKALEFSKKHREIKAALGLYPIDALPLSDLDMEKELR